VKPVSKPIRFLLSSKADHLKGNWFLWHCVAEMPDGTEAEGTVQADGQGEGVAEDTWEADL
jgi:hypothetical protein